MRWRLCQTCLEVERRSRLSLKFQTVIWWKSIPILRSSPFMIKFWLRFMLFQFMFFTIACVHCLKANKHWVCDWMFIWLVCWLKGLLGFVFENYLYLKKSVELNIVISFISLQECFGLLNRCVIYPFWANILTSTRPNVFPDTRFLLQSMWNP